MNAAHATNTPQQEILFIRDLNKKKAIVPTTELELCDPSTGEALYRCSNPDPDLQSKAAKVIGGAVAKSGPFNIRVSSAQTSAQAFRIARASAAFKIPPICLFDERDELIGSFREPLLALSKTYRITSSDGQVVHVLQIKPGLNRYRLFLDKEHAATVHLKWGGVNSGFFKEHCTAVIQFEEAYQLTNVARQVLMSAAICLDLLR